MAHQATMTHGGNGSPVTDVLSGIGEMGNNVVTLATLQARLAAADARESLYRARPALVATALVIPLTIAAFTSALVGSGLWLSTLSGLSVGSSLIIVAIIAMTLSGIVGALVVARLRMSFESFRRTREEMERNIAWLGTVLKQSRR
jgi:Putative Actinobacterial Holin-X, holin superfamily III